MENPIVRLVEQGVELAQELKKATEDGKIGLFEWVGLVREASDVVKASLDVKANDITELTDLEIESMTDEVMNSIDREVKFMRDDVVDVLKLAQTTYRLISRER